MDLRERLKMESIVRGLAVWKANQRLKEEQTMSRKEERFLPPSVLERLRSDVKDAQANVFSVRAALAAVEKYPPLRT